MLISLPTPKSTYVVNVCKDMIAWDLLVDESPQGHVFSKSTYLQSLGGPYACYEVASPQGEILAGAAVLLSDSAMARAPFAFSPYQGIIFSKHISSLNHQKRLTAEFRITKLLIEVFINIFTNFSMALSPFFKDLRPFLWHNYGNKELPQFEIRQRYTGHLSLIDFDFKNYLDSVRVVRRQEYKKIQAVFEPSFDLNLFMSLYKKTFDRQGIDLTDETLSRVKNICTKALSGGYGRLSSVKVNGNVASMAFFLTDQSCSCAYYLFGANDPSLRFANASSKLLIDSIVAFAAQGFKRFDFVGVNSPQRGDFKLSFNAELVLYHEVHLLTHE